MSSIGIFEGFFGPAWTGEGRSRLSTFLQKYGFGFYVYAPKADPNLRRNWRSAWSDEYLEFLKSLAQSFQSKGVRFGVGLSPFGMNSQSQSDCDALTEKIKLIQSLRVDQIGIFFDDMKWEEGALQSQLKTLEIVRSHLKSEILFCPTFYSDDPVLDKVFGQRPENYLSEIGRQVPKDIQILWTGPKVISPEISAAHLEKVSETLQRSPFIWDNVFANDGPKQCKFLKIKSLSGRSQEALARAQGWAFNPMNQITLSEIVVLSAQKVLRDGQDPEVSLKEAISELCSSDLARVIENQAQAFLKEGLDQLDESLKQDLILNLAKMNEPAAMEVKSWLQGQFIVGNECLTD